MLRLRMLFLWLLMAAVPLQGFAAATMLLCETGSPHQQVHSHAAHHHAEVAHGKAPDDHGKSSGATHKCGTCAACCNAVAMVGSLPEVAVAPVPKAELAEPLVLIRAHISSVPDKPPRA